MSVSRALLTAALAVLALPTSAMAKDIVVEMRNKGSTGVMVFEPAFVSAAIGDSVHFVPADPGHNAEPIADILPAGITLPAGKFSQEYVVKVSKPGLYGFKCAPHYSMGMVALVKVGKGTPANLAQASAAKLPPLATKRMQTLLAQAK